MPAGNAREYLLQLQRAAIGRDRGSAYDEFVIARNQEVIAASDHPERRQQQQDNLERQNRMLARYRALVPTPLQSVQDYARLFDAKARIDGELERAGEYRPRGNLVFGSVDATSLHAQTAYLPDSDEYLVVFSRGLLLLLLLGSNLAAVAMSFDPRLFSDRIHEELLPQLAPSYGALLAAIHAGEMPPLENAIPVFYLPMAEKRWTALEDGAFDFVVAHEYTHVLRGHLVRTDGEITDDRGGWGAEYEADSIALDLAVQACAARNEGNPAAIAMTLQGICIFFVALCAIERFGAELHGDASSAWNEQKHHPPSYVRWRRMVDKVRSRAKGLDLDFFIAQMNVMEVCLAKLYQRAVADRARPSPVSVEWHFQRAAWETMAGHSLVPQHIFIALHCTQAAMAAGTPLDEAGFAAAAAEADVALEAAGARQLKSYGQPLPDITREMSARALKDAISVTPAAMLQIVERLKKVVLLDARTRYPKT